jgi:peptidoglycan hydrolase-like protein with peptidoglycan-binding domain
VNEAEYGIICVKFIGVFGPASATATAQFQKANGLSADGSGILGVETAQKLLDLHSADGYKDSGFTAASMGYLFKLHVPVHNNRSIETVSTLYDKNNNVLLTFTTRTHGHRYCVVCTVCLIRLFF